MMLWFSGFIIQVVSCGFYCINLFTFNLQPSILHCKMAQQQRKSSTNATFIAKYIDEQNQSSDEEPEIEVFESPDYEPFMGNFRKFYPGMSTEAREDVLTRGLINLRANPHMRNIMQKMFDYDLEESDLEEIFMDKEKLNQFSISLMYRFNFSMAHSIRQLLS